MKSLITLPILLLILASGCQPNTSEISTTPDNDDQFATSPFGMVASAHPLATEAGDAILEAGGNAADAAVAVAFVIAVVEPTMNGIGGRNQILVRNTNGTFQGYNGMTEIPIGYVAPEKPVSSGHGTIAAPGVVAALMRLHAEHGSLPLPQIMEASIRIAEEGFSVLPGEATRHAMARKAMMADPGFRKQMLKDDSITYTAGETLKQPDLANTLTRIAATNGRDFYEGETARRIVADMEANGGFITLEDLKNYKALDARYVTTDYRGYQIHSIPAPAGGGLVVKALNIMEQFDLSNMTDAQWAAVVSQALALSVKTLKTDYQEEDLTLVQSKEWAKQQAESIVVPIDIAEETSLIPKPKNTLPLLASVTDWSGDTWGKDSHHTTHFVTADCNGMVVSITQTVGPLFGSKVITPGLGFVYASTMGEYLATSDQAPGSRPRTTIAPTIITKNGETVMVLGAAGGLRILSGIVQTISRKIDRGMSLREAVAAPRIHPESEEGADGENTIDPMKFSAEFTPENGWQATDSIVWQKAGFQLTSITRYGAFARVHAVGRDPKTEAWIGVADLDWEGTAAGPDRSVCAEGGH